MSKATGDHLMARIKVIHVITRFDKGGSAENTFLTVRGLDRQFYEVHLVIGSSQESLMGKEEQKAAQHNLEEVEESGVKVVRLNNLVRNIHPFKDICALYDLFVLFRKEKPQIVHTHTSKAGIIGRWAARLARVPVIIHTPHGHVFWGYFNRWVSCFYSILERWTARITDRIITLTEQEKKDHLYFRIASPDKFEVIHSGVELEKFQSIQASPEPLRKELGIPHDAIVVGTAGRLTPIKGHRYLIEAAKQVIAVHLETHFLIIGDGELLSDLLSLAANLGIGDHVHFAGWRTDISEILSTCDIFAFPSLNEGMGKAIVEAMALGKPVIASRVGGIIDLVRDGENGFLIPPADVGSLAESIQILVADPEKRRLMGIAGKRASVHYGSAGMIVNIDALYKHFLDRAFINEKRTNKHS